ncbi:MAG: DUF86 domain-containing protein [Candidatus Hydrogenedens sp.]|nr:DUF86 domain-containing protein [Candidatus Hydrogenedens sp.]
MNDVVLNKLQSIQRCVARAREEYGQSAKDFVTDYTRQDAAVLNVLRACEQTIDLANHVVKLYKLGSPSATAESFTLLVRAGVISEALAVRLTKMIRFRNVVVHAYQQADIEVVQGVIQQGLDDLLECGEAIRRFADAQE